MGIRMPRFGGSKLHDGLKEIRRQAFNNCISLTSIDIPGSVTDFRAKNTEVSTSQYEGWVFENCTNLSTITLHEGLKKLYVSTFSVVESYLSIYLRQ